jgi:hypothetical protein
MQVAAMMQQQQSMFTGMQQYSQVISSQMPQPMMNTIGNYGQQPMAPQFSQVPYAPRQQPGFSYGGGGFGYGMGNQFGAAGVSALGGAGSFALGGLGIAGGLGMLGRAGTLFDPIGAGMGAFGAARGIGMGMAGGLGVGALAAGAVAAPMMFAQHAIGSMVTGAQEQAGINQALGGFNFQNSMSRTGRGFSRQDAMAIGSMTRELQSIPEMMTSMSELTRIMDKMGQTGMMQGVRDAGEFSKRFRETIHTLRDVSKMMGSTMEEAMQAFQESKQSGFYSPQAIKQNIMQRQIVSGVTGMNQGQIAQMQAYGADVSHQFGGSKAGGARSITRIAGELGMANQMGLLSNDQLMEMTGAEGAEGIQRLSGSLNDAGQRMGRSSLGTAMTLALGEVKDGRYTGGMDQDLVRRVRAGEIGKGELLSLAHKKSAGRNAKLSFAAHRQRLTTEMVNSAGVQGISMELGEILGERGFDNPDALNLVMQRYGVGEEQANQIMGLMKQMPGIQRGMAEAGSNTVRTMAEQSFMKENASWEGIKTKIGKKFENALTEPFKKMGANISNSIGEAVDNFVDDIFGRYQAKVTDMASNTALRASMGDVKAKSLMDSARAGTGNLRGRGQDLRNNSAIGGALNWLGGNRTAGDVQADVLKSMGSDYYDTIKGSGSGIVDSAMEKRILAGGGSILSKEGGMFSAGEYTVSTAASKERAIKALQGANPLLGKLDISKGAAGALFRNLKETLLTDGSLHEEGLSDADKLAKIQERLGATGVWQGKDINEALNAVKKQTGSSNTADIIDALAQAGGLGNQIGMFNRGGLAGGLGKFGTSRELATNIRDSISSAAGGFGDKSALAKTVLTEGGASAKILGMAFGGGKMGDAVSLALNEKEGSSVSKEILDSLGMTQKEFDAARGQSRELMMEGRQHGANGGAIKDILMKQLGMADLKMTEHERDLGEGLSGRLKGADLGGLTKGGRGIADKLDALAKSLAGGKGFGDTGDLLTTLADYKGADRGKLLGLAGEEVGAGVQEVTDVRRAYKRSRGVKGGKSVDALIEKLGLTGPIADDVRKMAGGDSAVNDSEEKAIEKYLGDARTKTLSAGGAKGSGEGSVNAAKNLQDYLTKSSENMSNVATILQGIVAKQTGTTSGGKP